jgi:hypothetical protein
MSEDMMCCPLSGLDDSTAVACSTQRQVKARKEHSCYECGESIKVGDRHEVYSGIFDHSAFRWRTCLSCVEIRDHFACNGFSAGQLWDDLESNFFPDMKAGGPCMAGLSPEAKARLFDRRLRWLEETSS